MFIRSQSKIDVVAGIIMQKGRLLICKRPDGGLHSGMWEFPGGKIEVGETPEGALAREIREELDIDVEVGHLRWETEHDYAGPKVHLRFYECRLQRGEAKNYGVERHEWVLPSQLEEFDFLPADIPLIKTLRSGGLLPPTTEVRSVPKSPDVQAAYEECLQMAASHYENFPVASRLLSREIRRHVAAIYAFARCADDIADEHPASNRQLDDEERLVRLSEWERRLELAAKGAGEGPVFTALAHTICVQNLPIQPFRDLLAAFRQDILVKRYSDFDSLLEYCRLSANPIGRLVLMLHGVRDEQAFRESDAICSALQIANHLQDVKADFESGRVYLPQEDLRAFCVREEDLNSTMATSEFRALMAFQIRRVRGLFFEGFPLLHRVGGRFGRELRAIFRGGLAALESIERENHDVLKRAPRLRKWDKAAAFLAAFLSVSRVGRLVEPAANDKADMMFCRWLVNSSRSNFYSAIRILPRDRRRGMAAIYAFCRVVDDIVDNPGDVKDKRRKLKVWKRAIMGLGEGEYLHPIVRELARVVSAFGVDPKDLREICEGMEMDLKRSRYDSFEDLQTYCFKVASSVGLACMKVFGEDSLQGKEYAISLGMALQLTNILRDLRVDAEMGRIYIPLDDMNRFGVTEEEILEGGHSKCLVELLRFEAWRAQAFFEEAESSLPVRNRIRLFPARFMGAIYRRMLQRMLKLDFPPKGWNPSLSKWAKIREALVCLLTS